MGLNKYHSSLGKLHRMSALTLEMLSQLCEQEIKKYCFNNETVGQLCRK